MSGSNTSTTSSGGIGFAGALTLLFIGLKLGGVITWSWWWVLSPLWISVGFALVLLAIAAVIVVLTPSRSRYRR